MKTKIIVALITGAFTISAALISAFVSLKIGKTEGENNVINQVSEAVADVTGNNNIVTINDVSTFIKDYENIKKENDQVKELNTQYIDQLAQSNDQVNELTKQMGDTPIINYQDLGLSIDGEDIVVNSKEAVVTINNREYVSKEIVEKLIGDNKNILYKDNKMYIGRIVADKANLLEQWNIDMSGCERKNNINDSYGNNHSDALQLFNSSCKAVYNLDRKYSMLKFSAAIEENAKMNYAGVLTIKADDNVVYTSTDLNKTTEPFMVSDIAIGNCSLLTIEYNTTGGWYNDCLIYDASVYN